MKRAWNRLKESKGGSGTDFRSNVVGRPAKRLGRLIPRDAFFAHSEVGDLDVPVLVQQNVVQLEVPVNDAASVKEEEPDRYFRSVESAEALIVKGGKAFRGQRKGTYTATGSLNLPHCCIWYIKSPPFTYSMTK